MSVADSFFRSIKEGIVTIDNVPTLWRAKVQQLLDEDEKNSEPMTDVETDETEA